MSVQSKLVIRFHAEILWLVVALSTGSKWLESSNISIWTFFQFRCSKCTRPFIWKVSNFPVLSMNHRGNNMTPSRWRQQNGLRMGYISVSDPKWYSRLLSHSCESGPGAKWRLRAWWSHHIETLYTLLGRPPVTVGFPTQRTSNVWLWYLLL